MTLEGLLLALAVGGGIGTFFFVGLRWTLERALRSKHAAALFLGSYLVRVSATVGGFYLVGHAHWSRLVACLVGFVLARELVTRRFGKTEAHASQP